MLFAASPAGSALYVSASVHGVPIDESDTIRILPGTTLPIDITIWTDANPNPVTGFDHGEALALGLRAANYDPGVLTNGVATIVPAAIFGVPGLPQGLGGIQNSASGSEQAPAAGVRAGWSINLFQGVTVNPPGGTGPETFQIMFVGGAPGVTFVDIGAFPEYSDTYSVIAGNDSTVNALRLTVCLCDDVWPPPPPIPEPTTALLLGLGLTGLAYTRPGTRA